MENFELAAKLIASGGLTLVLMVISLELWKRYQEQVKGRIDDLNARIENLEASEVKRDAKEKATE